jgi:hypothetical protein
MGDGKANGGKHKKNRPEREVPLHDLLQDVRLGLVVKKLIFGHCVFRKITY